MRKCSRTARVLRSNCGDEQQDAIKSFHESDWKRGSRKRLRAEFPLLHAGQFWRMIVRYEGTRRHYRANRPQGI